MPGRQQIPSFQLASGTTNERDNSYNISNTLGSIFYNTDTSNVEVYHEDPSNTLDWRDLVMNNKEQIDISGKLVVEDDVSFNAHLSATDASFQNNVDISGNVICATAPTGVNDLCNKAYVDAFQGTTKAWGISGHSSPGVNMSVGPGNYFPYNASYTYIHYNIGGLWSGLQATIDQDGLYYISWGALCPDQLSGIADSRPSIYINNGTKHQIRGTKRIDAGNSVSAIMELDSGDTVSIRTQVGKLQWYNNYNYNMCCGYLIKAL